MSDLPRQVHVMEVGPRDGLQIESRIVSVADRLRMIEMIARAGVKEIEVGSFVNPRAVPQMADTDAVFAALDKRRGVAYRGLWLNPRGLDRALANGKVDVDGKLTLSVSETFARRNTNRGIDDTLAEMPAWIARYRDAGIAASSLVVMTAFGCNFEGPVRPEAVVGLVARAIAVMAEHGARLEQLSLADTMGWAHPVQIKRVISQVRDRWPDVELKLHLHDTRGCAVANAVAAMECGVKSFDASVGGLGGCPFAGHKGAAGNICTEDLVFACEEMGIETGIDLDALVEAAKFAEGVLGRELPGKVMKGGTLTQWRVGHA